MADTFVIREVSDEESDDGTSVKKTRTPLEVWEERAPARVPLSSFAKANEMMDFYIFSSTFLLWSTAIVLTFFSVFILQAEYGLAMLVQLDLYSTAMILQLIAGFVNIVCAAVTTSLLRMDKHRPRRAVVGFFVVLLLVLILIAVITVSKRAKKEIQDGDLRELDHSTRSVPRVITKEAESKGLKCLTWEDKDCQRAYREHANNFSNYLVGSSAVGIGINLSVLPVFILVYKFTSTDVEVVLANGEPSRVHEESQSLQDIPTNKKTVTINPNTSQAGRTSTSDLYTSTYR